MRLSAEDRARVMAEASRAAHVGGLLQLRAGGRVLAPGTDLDELLGAAVRRERVELEVDLLAFEQGARDAAGERVRNRNGVRFRDGAMLRLGRSGKGKPYLRDHRQGDSTAVGGRIVSSETVRVDDQGHAQIKMTVLATEPAAVERLLRGLVFAVSIGWHPTGPVICTACKTEILTECWHWPLDVVKAGDVEHVVEWEYTEAELIEVSECPVPAVPTAGIEGIRAALSAALVTGPAPATASRGEAAPPPERITMTLRQTLLARLQLAGLIAATAANTPDVTDEQIVAGVDELLADRAELAIARTEASSRRVSEGDKFVREALDTGRIGPADEKLWRDLFAASPSRARERMAERPAGVATPVGQPRQAAAPEPTAEQLAAATGGTTPELVKRDTQTKKVLAANGVDFDQATKFAAIFGASDPKAAIAKHAAGVEEV